MGWTPLFCAWLCLGSIVSWHRLRKSLRRHLRGIQERALWTLGALCHQSHSLWLGLSLDFIHSSVFREGKPHVPLNDKRTLAFTWFYWEENLPWGFEPGSRPFLSCLLLRNNSPSEGEGTPCARTFAISEVSHCSLHQWVHHWVCVLQRGLTSTA